MQNKVLAMVLITMQREACPPMKIQPVEAEKVSSSSGSVSLSQYQVTYENINEEQSTQNHSPDSINGAAQGPNGAAGNGGGAEEPKNPLEVETVYSVLQYKAVVKTSVDQKRL